jgi:regulatory subunit for Cdc7p protein kinase
MSTRRAPLSSNPNAANSPLRGAAAALAAKQRRSHAEVQREEAYGQPPPAKRQMLDLGGGRAARSPVQSKAASARSASQRTTLKTNTADKVAAKSNPTRTLSEEELQGLRQWQTQLRARLPSMVFYFESLPDDQRARLTKQVTHLGAVSQLLQDCGPPLRTTFDTMFVARGEVLLHQHHSRCHNASHSF